jgi:alpha-galactosidase
VICTIITDTTHLPLRSDLKYDNCGVPSNWTDQYNYCVPDSGDNTSNPNGTCPGLSNAAPSGYDWSTSNTAKRYTQMRDALVSAQDTRTILFSLCEWGSAGIEEWGASMGNSWRTTGDIQGKVSPIYIKRT